MQQLRGPILQEARVKTELLISQEAAARLTTDQQHHEEGEGLEEVESIAGTCFLYLWYKEVCAGYIF